MDTTNTFHDRETRTTMKASTHYDSKFIKTQFPKTGNKTQITIRSIKVCNSHYNS